MSQFDELRERIDEIIRSLLIHEPFFGMALAKSWIIARNDISTVATDGLRVFINPNHANELDSEKLTKELLHALGHIIFRHVPRMRARNAEPRLWHFAADAVLQKEMFNDDSILREISKMTGRSVDDLARMSTEEIYELLINTSPNQNQNNQQSQGGKCPMGGVGRQNRQNQGEGGDGSKQNDGGEGNSNEKNVKGHGKQGSEQGNQGDQGQSQGQNQGGEHNGANDSEGGEGKGNEPNNEVRGGFGDAFTSGGSIDDAHVIHRGDDEDRDVDTDERVEKRVNDKLVEIFNALKMIGRAPAWLERLVDELSAPKINWRDVLKAVLDRALGREIMKKWSILNRHFPELKPGKQIYGLDRVAVLVDTSGSISDEELRQFVSEVFAVLKSHAVREVFVVPWDAEAYDPIKLTSPGQIEKVKVGLKGGGGTVIRPALEMARKLKAEYIIILSDWDIFDINDAEVQKLLRGFKRVIAITTHSDPIVPKNAIKLYLPLKS